MQPSLKKQLSAVATGKLKPVSVDRTPRVVVEVITPERAKRDFENRRNFRQIADGRVRVLARDIATDNWDVNGETLKYDREGHNIDGQHRLAACIMAGKPFTTAVAYGIERETNIDTGGKRTFSQWLAANGFKDSIAMAGMLRISLLYLRGIRTSNIGSGINVSVNELEAAALEWPLVSQHLLRARRAQSIVSTSNMATLTFLAARTLPANKMHLLDYFVLAVGKGRGLNDEEAPMALRRHLHTERSRFKRYGRFEELLLLIKAWNFFATGRPLQKVYLTRQPKGESKVLELPEFVTGGFRDDLEPFTENDDA